MAPPLSSPPMIATESIPDKTKLSGRKLLEGSITLEHRIGKGGSGQVYMASDQKGTNLAVKVIDRPVRITQERRLLDEITCLQKLVDDPAVPSLHNVVEDSDFVYLIMDYCEGRTLAGFINRWESHKYSLKCFEAKKRIMLKLIRTIQRCHKRSIYHQDIKCANVLINENKENPLSLLDFGISTDETACYERRIGTTQYMSPECYDEFLNERPFSSERNDIWSLGGAYFAAFALRSNPFGLQPGLTSENHLVVFVVLMTGQMTWSEPTLKDENYAEFINHPLTYFRSTYGVTKDAQKLLSRVLTYDPAMRIDLDTFYDEVNALSRFFVPLGISQLLFSPRLTDVTDASHEPNPHKDYRNFWKQRSSLLRHHAVLHSASRSEDFYRRFSRQSTAGKRLASVALPGTYAAAYQPHLYMQQTWAPCCLNNPPSLVASDSTSHSSRSWATPATPQSEDPPFVNIVSCTRPPAVKRPGGLLSLWTKGDGDMATGNKDEFNPTSRHTESRSRIIISKLGRLVGITM